MKRVTSQKQQILEAFKVGYHPTAEELLKKIRKDDPKFSRATLYRNLVSFCEEGKLKKLNFFDGADRFEIISQPHCHIICEKCGRVDDFKSENLSIPETLLDYDITSYNLTYYGICPKCKERK